MLWTFSGRLNQSPEQHVISLCRLHSYNETCPALGQTGLHNAIEVRPKRSRTYSKRWVDNIGCRMYIYIYIYFQKGLLGL